ncbi:hypothetical protein B0H14DRAFT_2572655 [Mycena olivaceomarginata]|nr:hypothetical protein B0H14DRAFT_2572655 [Mycena olivaceomarginata]
MATGTAGGNETPRTVTVNDGSTKGMNESGKWLFGSWAKQISDLLYFVVQTRNCEPRLSSNSRLFLLNVSTSILHASRRDELQRRHVTRLPEPLELKIDILTSGSRGTVIVGAEATLEPKINISTSGARGTVIVGANAISGAT